MSDPAAAPAAALNNFSFVRPGQLAGMGKPVSASQVASLATEHNVGLVVSLGAPAPDALFVAAVDMQRLAIPWPDGGVPTTDDMARAVAEAAKVSGGGKAVVFHCGHGKGRTGTALASYLVLREGYAADAAIAEIRSLRPGSVETEAQAAFVAELAAASASASATATNERVLS